MGNKQCNHTDRYGTICMNDRIPNDKRGMCYGHQHQMESKKNQPVQEKPAHSLIIKSPQGHERLRQLSMVTPSPIIYQAPRPARLNSSCPFRHVAPVPIIYVAPPPAKYNPPVIKVDPPAIKVNPPAIVQINPIVEKAAKLDRKPGEDPEICSVCLDRPKCVIFMPCNHLACCAECTPNIKPPNCPICRTKMQMTVNLKQTKIA
jgi:hypothetical protein